jgi:hypothetical protein
VAIVGSWDFPSEQSFRRRNRYDYKPRTLFCWWEKLTAALCGRNIQMAQEHMAHPTILLVDAPSEKSLNQRGADGRMLTGAARSKGKNP